MVKTGTTKELAKVELRHVFAIEDLVSIGLDARLDLRTACSDGREAPY
jgi:hypothetical protein